MDARHWWRRRGFRRARCSFLHDGGFARRGRRGVCWERFVGSGVGTVLGLRREERDGLVLASGPQGLRSLQRSRPAPWAYVMEGTTRTKPSFTDRLAEAGAAPIGGASYGALCAPRGSLGSLTSVAKATTSKPSRIRCSFPSNPLLHVQVLANGNRRLRLVLSPRQLVVIADVRTKGSTISYSTKYCKRTAAP